MTTVEARLVVTSGRAAETNIDRRYVHLRSLVADRARLDDVGTTRLLDVRLDMRNARLRVPKAMVGALIIDAARGKSVLPP